MKNLNIKILGSRCGNCQRLEKNVRQVVDALGISATVQKVQELDQFIAYNIARIPALVINEKVVSQGVVLPPEKIRELLQPKL
ncbi:MAG: hypothetical protein Kow0042_28610 [Calditrichia bacterium]